MRASISLILISFLFTLVAAKNEQRTNEYAESQKVDLGAIEVAMEFQKKAEQGDAPTHDVLGIMHKNANFVDVNYKKSIELYEKAAKQGYADAQGNLGAMYYKDQGVDQDDSMAMRWYAKAAAQGHEQAQGRIAAILARRRRRMSTAGSTG